MGAILVGLAVFGGVVLLVIGRGDLLAYTPLVVMAVCAITGVRAAPVTREPADDELGTGVRAPIARSAS